MNIIIFLLILSFIVAIHELGHLIAAKIFGVYCYEYAIGMGPQLFKTQKKETVYALRLLPIGGFVAMAGAPEDDEAYPDVVVPKGRHLSEQATWKKVIVMLAGVIMNFILAWLLFSFVLLSSGHYKAIPKAVIGKVQANSPAYVAGLKEGDIVTQIKQPDGKVSHPMLFSDLSIFQNEQAYKITVKRQGTAKTFVVYPKYNSQEKRYYIGITNVEVPIKKVNVVNMLWYGAIYFKDITILMLKSLSQLFQGIGLKEVSGPLGIYQATKTYAQMGLWPLLFLMGQLSLNIGIFNLLPLPVLDGGQIVIAVIEGLLKRKLKDKYKLWIILGCWGLLIALMLYATWNDIVRIFLH